MLRTKPISSIWFLSAFIYLYKWKTTLIFNCNIFLQLQLYIVYPNPDIDVTWCVQKIFVPYTLEGGIRYPQDDLHIYFFCRPTSLLTKKRNCIFKLLHPDSAAVPSKFIQRIKKDSVSPEWPLRMKRLSSADKQLLWQCGSKPHAF